MESFPRFIIILIILICLFISVLFTLSENAFANCNIYHYKVLAENNNRKAKLIYNFANKYNDSLVTVLVGYNLMQAAISSLAAILLLQIAQYYKWANGVESIVSTIIVTIVLYLFTDFLPKIISKTSPDRTAEFVIYPIYICHFILYPIILLFRGILFLVKKIFKSDGDLKITKEEFIEKASEASDEVLEQNEKIILNRALKFDKITVLKVLTKKEKIFSIDIKDLTINKLNKIILYTNYSRIPIYENSKENIIGILNLRTYFSEYINDPHLEIRSILNDVIKVDENEKVDDIFEKLNHEKTHIAFVYNNDKELIGMITMQDILEELVGDINEKSSKLEAK